jgi:hypothetical protein
MGYDIHITRAEEWSESEANPITLDEWRAYVASDPEMRIDGFAETKTLDGTVLRLEGEGLTVWTAWPGEAEDDHAWLECRLGRITVKNPDPLVLAKMCAIADRLGARVQGDEGEYYPESLDPEAMQDPEELAEELRRKASGARSPWWKRLFFGR